jgi:tetratricopeptide (TPR) repeat protein
MEDLPKAAELLERAATQDPGDVVTWGLLADVRQRAGDARGAAEACESLARTSVVPEHQLLAWYDAGRMWIDDVKDEDRGIIALEAAAAIDVGFQDTFQRLQALYAARRAQAELASLLERRLEKVTDPEERTSMEIERGRVLLEVGDPVGARTAFQTVLSVRPDDPVALAAFADLCAQQHDWEHAEQAWVRLARLLPGADEQIKVYTRLGDLYASHAPNLSRAETAFKEVLKRAPDDVTAMSRLVDVYRRQNDSSRAVELQQELVNRAVEHADKRQRLVELADIYESTGHDNRKAEQTLETARRAFPMDVVVLRALADFYRRHNQLPAINILLDRASGDARRAIAAGRFAPGMFEMMQACFDLRGKKDAARVVAATVSALAGEPADIAGAGVRALDPRLDEQLAPEAISAAVRALLARTGDALDAAAPLDLRSLIATPLPPSATSIAQLVGQAAQGLGLTNVQVLVSPKTGKSCLAASSAPPTIVLGEGLLSHPSDAVRTFLVVRALKLVATKGSALARTMPPDLLVLTAGWLHAFNPSWRPEGIHPAHLAEATRRVQSALPRNMDPNVGVLALEVAGTLGAHLAHLGLGIRAWANHVGLLAAGDPGAGLEGIALNQGTEGGAPADPKLREAWIGREHEAKDLVGFSVSDQLVDARGRLGI